METNESCLNEAEIQSIEESLNAVPPIEVINEESCPSLPPLSEGETIRLELLKLAQSKPDELKLDLMLKEISKKYDIGRRIVQRTYMSITELLQKEAASLAEKEEQKAKDIADERKHEQMALALKRAQEIAHSSDIFEEFRTALKTYSGYIASDLNASTILVSHASRLLDKSSAFIICGPSASGKSDLIEKGAEYLPPECVLRCTSFSNQALQYIGPLTNKYVVGGELKPLVPGEDDSFQQAFRQLISENMISRATSEKDENGIRGTKIYRTTGPVTFIFSTTREQTNFNDEFVNRLSWCPTSDEPGLTRQVLQIQAESAMNPPNENRRTAIALEKEAWREFHRSLEPLIVKIPFADQILVNSSLVTTRRLNLLLLNYISASAILNQFQRKYVFDNGTKMIVANHQDYKKAYYLITANAPRALDLVGPRAIATFEKIRHLFGNTEFTVAQIRKVIPGLSLATAKRHIADLQNAGCIAFLKKDGKAFLYQIVQEPAPMEDLGLVQPDAISIDGVQQLTINELIGEPMIAFNVGEKTGLGQKLITKPILRKGFRRSGSQSYKLLAAQLMKAGNSNLAQKNESEQ